MIDYSEQFSAEKEQELFENESWDELATYLPEQVKEKFVSIRTIAQSMLRNPGRFRSPISLSERFLLFLTFKLPGFFDPFSLATRLPQSGLSISPDYPWQILTRYLVRERVITPPGHWETRFLHDEPKYIMVLFSLALTSGTNINGAGSGFDLGIAYSKAIGEALERFFFMQTKVYQVRVARRASAARLRQRHTYFLHPEQLSHFTVAQRSANVEFDFDERVIWSWVRGTRLSDQRSILIPAQCVSFAHFHDRGRPEPVLRDRNTNAAAGGFTLTEALVSGICEAIERDGFLIYWMNGIAPPVIDVSSCADEELRALLDDVRRYRLEPIFLNTTTDVGVPSCVCVIVDRGAKGPNITLGGGCGFDSIRILKRSLLEALTVRREQKKAETALDETYQPFVDKKINLMRRIQLWRNPAMFSLVEPFISGPKQSLAEAFPKVQTLADPAVELAELERRLARLGPGYEIYYYEHQHRILDRIGYHVVRVIIPELAHIHLFEHRAGLGANRLKTVPPKLGYEVAKAWNPWPHPFP